MQNQLHFLWNVYLSDLSHFKFLVPLQMILVQLEMIETYGKSNRKMKHWFPEDKPIYKYSELSDPFSPGQRRNVGVTHTQPRHIHTFINTGLGLQTP